MPIVIQQNQALIEVNSESISPKTFQDNTPKTRPGKRAYHVERAKRDPAKRRSSKSKGAPMRFDDEEDYDAGEVATILGDPSVNMLGLKISDGKSRDKLHGRDDTMRLDQASSRDQLTGEDPAVNRSNDMSILKIAKKDQMQERSLDATTSSKVIRSSLEASQRTEEAQR